MAKFLHVGKEYSDQTVNAQADLSPCCPLGTWQKVHVHSCTTDKEILDLTIG